MTRADIDQIACYKRKMPDNASVSDWIYYFCAEALYRGYERKDFNKREAIRLKNKISAHLDTIQMLAQSNHQIILELEKATAPRAELVKKDKAELLDIIARIEGVVTGLMKEFNGKVPEFLKMEE